MATSVPAIIWPINFALQSGNPLCQGVSSAAPLESAQLIQGDQRLLQVYFLLAAAQQGAVATNVQLVSGSTLTVAGKLATALGASTVLFESTGFVQLQDANSLYFDQAFLDLDTAEIAAAFAAAGTGQTTLACLVDVIVNVPAQAAAGGAPAVPASRATFQIAVTIKQQVYSGDESTPTPATPTYPTPAAITAAIAEAGMAKYYLLTITSAAGGGGATDLSGVDNTNFALYQAVEIPEYRTNAGVGSTTWVLENVTDAFGGGTARTCPAFHNPGALIWRQRS